MWATTQLSAAILLWGSCLQDGAVPRCKCVSGGQCLRVLVLGMHGKICNPGFQAVGVTYCVLPFLVAAWYLFLVAVWSGVLHLVVAVSSSHSHVGNVSKYRRTSKATLSQYFDMPNRPICLFFALSSCVIPTFLLLCWLDTLLGTSPLPASGCFLPFILGIDFVFPVCQRSFFVLILGVGFVLTFVF